MHWQRVRCQRREQTQPDVMMEGEAAARKLDGERPRRDLAEIISFQKAADACQTVADPDRRHGTIEITPDVYSSPPQVNGDRECAANESAVSHVAAFERIQEHEQAA